jgi:hypothetical protein
MDDIPDLEDVDSDQLLAKQVYNSHHSLPLLGM